MDIAIDLAPGAEENGLAVMLADLVRQNLEGHPKKKEDVLAIAGGVSIVADDAEVALTLCFDRGRVTIHDGIVGIPDLTIRGESDAILAMSTLPPLGVRTLANREAREGARTALATLLGAFAARKLHLYGVFFHLPLLLRLARVMSVHA